MSRNQKPFSKKAYECGDNSAEWSRGVEKDGLFIKVIYPTHGFDSTYVFCSVIEEQKKYRLFGGYESTKLNPDEQIPWPMNKTSYS